MAIKRTICSANGTAEEAIVRCVTVNRLAIASNDSVPGNATEVIVRCVAVNRLAYVSKESMHV